MVYLPVANVDANPIVVVRLGLFVGFLADL